MDRADQRVGFADLENDKERHEAFAHRPDPGMIESRRASRRRTPAHRPHDA